jgi:acetyl esterase/lipase
MAYRRLSIYSTLLIATLACESGFAGEGGAIGKSTFTFKRVGGLEIRADVYRPKGTEILPVVVNIHGGALMKMDRSSVPPPADLLMQRGFIVVSIDYRLGPESKLPEMLGDVVDGCAWVRRDGPRLFGADPSRFAVVGASAGGYLALAAGYLVKPRPDAVVSVFGFSELIGKWATSPSPDPEHWETKISPEEAARMPAGKAVSNADERSFKILPYYNYFRQNGLWPKMLTGWDPLKEREKYLPYLPLYNVTPEYPPTMLIHGTKDPDVPVEQSKLMAEELRKKGVVHETVYVEGAQHGLRGVDPATARSAYEAGADFVVRCLNKPAPVRH